MQLKAARVSNYKCVEDSTEFSVDQTTAIVGKNESGKTSILRALYKLNPYDESDAVFNKEEEYPRRYLVDYSERHSDGDANVLDTVWEIEDFENDKITELIGPNSLKSRELRVTKGYDNVQYWNLSIDEGAVAEHVLSAVDLYTEEREELKCCTSIAGVKLALEALGGSASPRQAALLAKINSQFKRGTATKAVIDTLSLPKFLYFSSYDRMNGQVALDDLLRKKNANQLSDDDKVFLAFLGLIGMKLEDLSNEKKFEPMVARLESASIKISREIFEYWSQNRHLKVQFRMDAGRPGDPLPFNSGQVLRTRILNTHHDVSVSFDDRSTGFVWFFSFLVLFSQVKKFYGNNLIILLDEPGLSLHAKAQADLLRYFNEKVNPHHQLIYSTHSPFMIPTDNLLCVRTVEDLVREHDDGRVEILGTKVKDNVLSTDRETLFPLQGALGYEVTQSLFVGKHTLLLEGPSDYLYLKAFSEELHRRKRTGLDRRWTLCAAGGVDKIGAFMSLFGANHLHVAMFIDFAKGQKKKVDDLRRSQLLRSGHVYTADMFTDQVEADTEDMLGKAAFCALLNATYALTGSQALDSSKLPEISPRVLLNVESHFRTLPLGAPEFDHYRPSAHLFEHQAELFKTLPELEPAFGRFEKLFVELNALLT